MKRELRCACHGELLGYEVTPGDDNTGPCTEEPRYQALVNAVNQHRANHPGNPAAHD